MNNRNQKTNTKSDLFSLILDSGIQVSKKVLFSTLLHVVDPYKVFVDDGVDSFLKKIALYEVSLFSESKHNMLRETLSSHPGVGKTTTRSVMEDQFVTSYGPVRTVVRDEVRERDRYILALSPILWIMANILANSPDARASFVQQISLYGHVPQVFSEIFKRTRNSTNGKYRFEPAYETSSWSLIVAADPALQNTFWDPAFLCSSKGVRYAVEFLVRLHTYESNYVPYVKIDKSTLPPLESGSFTTFCSYTVSSVTHRLTNSEVAAIKNSLPDESAIMMADATILNCKYFDENSHLYILHEYTADIYPVTGSFSSYAAHIVRRVCGYDTNPYNDKKEDRYINHTKQSFNQKEDKQSKTDKEVSPSQTSAFSNIGVSANSIRSFIKEIVYEILSKDFSNNKKFAYS